ncbi:MAG TPA: hypothetical protein VHV49_03110 [Pseudonocardiaceae bacterium]|jgi:hypothetical protein|nr:hypothetical protein [Pseudonocardiaceae bacterium]
MARTTSPQLSAVTADLPRAVVVAATAFVLAGALRLTAGAEQLGLSSGFAVLFFVVAAAQIAFGALLGVGAHRVRTTVVVVVAMVITLVLFGLWFVATTATVPTYPLMNGPYPVDVVDLTTAVLEVTSVIALCRSLPQPTRRRVAWTMIGLVVTAWLVWVGIITATGLSD